MRSAHLRNLDLNLLLVFDALMSERNVTRAAARVHLSQPAASRALGRLRRHFRDPLFLRRGGAMEPTARAAELAVPLRRALDQIARALAEREAFDPAVEEAEVRIATADYIELVLLPALAGRLSRDAPGITLVSRPVTRRDVADRLNTGQADLALWPLALDTGDLRSVTVMRETMVCIAAAHHPSIGDTLDLACYLSLHHVRVSPEGEGTSAVDNVLASLGLERRVRAVVSSHDAAPRIVTETEMIATIPRRIADLCHDPERLRMWPVPVPVPGFTVDMAWPQRLDDDPAHAWVRDVVSEVAEGLAHDPGNGAAVPGRSETG